MKTTVEVIGFLGILLLSAISVSTLTGCAIEMIAVVRTDEAVKGKLSISKETYDASSDSPESTTTSSSSVSNSIRRVLPGYSE